MTLHVERYVALGDSQSEGLCDGDEETGYRGWADRLAGHLAAVNPGIEYANLAIRGRTAAQVRAEQLEPALAMKPDLVTITAGVNDVLRPRFDVEAVAGELDAMFRELTSAGARVATIEYPDLSDTIAVARPLFARFAALNEAMASSAERYGVTRLRIVGRPVMADARFWSPDRLHGSTLGHERLAAGMAHELGLPGGDPDWGRPLPPLAAPSLVRRTVADAQWIATFLGPWIGRRIRGTSSGDGRSAKRPELAPVVTG